MSSKLSPGGHIIKGLSQINGPIVVVEGAIDAGYDEVVVVIGADGEERQGRVLEVGEGIAVVQVFSGTDGLTPAASRVVFSGSPMRIPVAEEMLGRVFDGLG